VFRSLYRVHGKCWPGRLTAARRVQPLQESALFDFRRGDGALLLLIIDRMDDPVTPLLSQWTYQASAQLLPGIPPCARIGLFFAHRREWRDRPQAMVHELLAIDNNRVDLRSLGSKIAKENQELVLSAEQDAFFHAQMYNNYGASSLHCRGNHGASHHCLSRTH
jgi:vacuolar protein sorting-associated protein 45